ncbi:MAG: hypothetical protein NTX11_00750 [Candidatus Saccharibacteria bacterium]|nr:hypothetical protein [Candidatus Saccharibacteria bacterium]
MDNYEYDPPYEHNIPVDLSEEGQQIVAGAEQMLRDLEQPDITSLHVLRKIGSKVLDFVSNSNLFYGPDIKEANYRRRPGRIQ